jgi:hypothetical protein
MKRISRAPPRLLPLPLKVVCWGCPLKRSSRQPVSLHTTDWHIQAKLRLVDRHVDRMCTVRA